jgi:hypothetical protein
MRHSTVLEFAITDFCNLKCRFCSQATPIQQDKKQISFATLQEYAKLIRPDEFETIKLSGGEPTQHKEFGTIARALPELFPNRRYVLATNGVLLSKYLDILDIFECIDLTFYPNERQPYMRELMKGLKGRNSINFAIKYNDEADLTPELMEEFGNSAMIAPMERPHGFPNKVGPDLYKGCGFPNIRKIVQDRMYACCIGFGLCEMRNLSREAASVAFDENWRENLATLEARMSQDTCSLCFVDVFPAKKAAA